MRESLQSHSWLVVTTLVVLSPVVVLADGTDGQTRIAHVLAGGSKWATPYYIVNSGRSGPVVMIVGGMHGNELAGSQAADQVSHWTIRRGKLVVIPHANYPGRQQMTAKLPAESGSADLLEDFSSGSAHSQVGKGIWNLARSEKVDWVVTLHSAVNYVNGEGKLEGGGNVLYLSGKATSAAKAILDSVNSDVSSAAGKYVTRKAPSDGSLVAAAARSLNASGVMVMIGRSHEDPTKQPDKVQPISTRARHGRKMVHALLKYLGMAESDWNVLVDRSKPEHLKKNGSRLIHVGIYDGPGCGTAGPRAIMRSISRQVHMQLHNVSQAEMQAGFIRQFDVIIFPGGGSGTFAKTIGKEGSRHVESFVKSGGGYVGVCAGAYLSLKREDPGPVLLNARTISRIGGSVDLDMELTEEGKRILGDHPGVFKIHFQNGPALTYGSLDLPRITPLAHYRSEVVKKGRKNNMTGSMAMCIGDLGKGRVFVSSPHPEVSDGLRAMIPRAVEWVAGEEPESFKSKKFPQ